jgi:hypothetical protein
MGYFLVLDVDEELPAPAGAGVPAGAEGVVAAGVGVGDVPALLPVPLLASVGLESGRRLSVRYQPEPLKITPTGWITLRVCPPQVGHSRTGSSAMRWRRSNLRRQALHSYS